MRIVIDLQACQSTGSRDRGIGRYSLALAKAMLGIAEGHEFFLLLNGLFADTIAPIVEQFNGLIPAHRVVVWHAPGPVAEGLEENRWRNRAAELVREQVIASLQPDVVHVTSLFEGSGDDAVVSIAANGRAWVTVVTLYDLIPLVYRERYLSAPAQQQWYFRKLHSLKQADCLLAISESTRQEAIENLRMSPERIVNMSSAVDAHFSPGQVEAAQWTSLQARFHITKNFVMYTGGIDWRKNIDGLIVAFAALPLALRTQYQLLIVCHVSDTVKAQLLAVAYQYGLAQDEVIFTGFVSDQDLLALYRTCTLFVFPSLHEGFGLPALEAMACGAPVIAANSSSLPEVIGDAQALFDGRNSGAITQKMNQALTQAEFRQRLLVNAKRQTQLFSWEATARRALEEMESLHRVQQARAMPTLEIDSCHKPRLAYVSPLPNLASGIAEYSAELLPELAAYYDICLIACRDEVSDPEVSDPYLSANFSIRSLSWFDEHAENFDRIVYHFGNSPLHLPMYAAFEKHPGSVVLHDFFLGDSLAYMEMHGIAPQMWSRALFESHGYLPLLEKCDAQQLSMVIQSYPCSLALAERANGVVVHSHYAYDLAQSWHRFASQDDWFILPLVSQSPVRLMRDVARRKLGFAEGDFLLCSFGMLGANKLNTVLIEAWANSSLCTDARCHLVFVGKNDTGEYGAQVVALMKSCEGGARISITGFVDNDTYRDYLFASDVAVQLRASSRGESSKAILDCMGHAVPVIANLNGAIKELPAHALLSLPDQFEVSQLQVAMETLRYDQARRFKLAKYGRDYVVAQHAPAVVAKEYAHCLERFYRVNHKGFLQTTLQKVMAIDAPVPSVKERQQLDVSLKVNLELFARTRFLLDVSDLDFTCANKRALLSPFLLGLMQRHRHLRIEFITLSEGIWWYAREQMSALFGIDEALLIDAPVVVHLGDCVACLNDLWCDDRPDAVVSEVAASRLSSLIGARVVRTLDELNMSE